jgi:ADP-ribosylglycohydrolase
MEKESVFNIHPLIRDRIRGCLLGVAIGDALGAPFEHLRPGMFDPRLAHSGGKIRDFHPYDGWVAGTWTDDTGMTMALCRGFIDHRKTNKPLEECIKDAFHSWAESPDSRRPGHTVYHAAKYGIADENSWGNGALMRSAPVAIYAHLRGYEQKKAVELALSVAGLTHGHPQATLPAVECVLALMSIFSAEKVVPRDLARAWYDLPEEAPADPRIKEYKNLRHLPINHCHPTTGLWMWRQVFEKCLGLEEGNPWMSIPDFEEGILKAVNEIADRDTAGGVAGALLGAFWGLEKIPGRFRGIVLKEEEILHLADELAGIGSPDDPKELKKKDLPGTPGSSFFRGYEEMKICITCTRIYGFYLDQYGRKSLYQKCGCCGSNPKADMPPSGKEEGAWPGFDFNEIFTLCYCCGREVLRSGTKWSVWFCEECKKRVMDFNTLFQQTVIPIGPHSLMVGCGLRATDSQDERKLRDFLTRVQKFFGNVTFLGEGRDQMIRRNLKIFGYAQDVLLVDYLCREAELPSKLEAFQSLIDFWGVPKDKLRMLFPEFRRN